MKPPDQLEMFAVPDPARPLLPAERIYPAEAKWTAWRGTHHPCGVCVRVAMQLGVGKAPVVMPARWKRVGPNDTTPGSGMFVCAPHGLELKPKDEAVMEYLKELRGRAPVAAPRRKQRLT